MAERHNILIVDDTPQNLASLGDMLEGQGYDVRVATSGLQALATSQSSRPDLILLDLLMPGMDGHEVCRRLKADPELRHIPVIYISALGMSEQKIQAFREGAVDYITKPFQADEVLARVRTHLQLTRVEHLELEIAERKRAEEQLRRSEEKFSRIYHLVPEAIAITRRSDGTFIDVNPGYETLFGYSRAETVGRTSLSLQVWPNEEVRRRIVDALDAHGEVLRWETQMRKKGGDTFVALFSGRMVEIEGERCILSMVQDITERQRTQELLLESEKMRTVAGLAAGMAHEINNPLAGVVQNAQVISDRLACENPMTLKTMRECGVDPAALSRFLEKREILQILDSIRSSGKRAAGIVQNMLHFSRRGGAELMPVSLPDLIERTLSLAANDSEQRARLRLVEVIKQYDPETPSVPCQEQQIQQVLLNLLRNAAQAMESNPPEKPRILTLHTGRRNDKALIEIQDTGPGIPPEIRQRIFEPFFTTKPVGQGTGLGLFVCYYIVTYNHNGQLSVEPVPGGGARFSIVLPMARGDNDAHSDRG